MAKISVITTVFNGRQYIDNSIESILGQDHSDFEWVIVDDGSRDDTLPVLYSKVGGDPRVRIVEAGRVGRSAALNIAVQQSEGKYIANHDIDDVSFAHRLSTQAEILDSNPQVGVVGGNHIAQDKTRGEKYVREQPKTHADIIKAMTHYIPISHNIATFRKSVWEEVGGYPESDNAIDMRLWLKVLDTDWKFCNPASVLGKHVIHSHSFWKSNFSYFYRQLDLFRLNIKVLRKEGLGYAYYLYPFSRLVYALLPSRAKSIARKVAYSFNKKG
jgi:glycosyltransferase involved in cell wall biosynthesis